MPAKFSRYAIGLDAPPLTKVKTKNAATVQVAAKLYRSSLRITYAFCIVSCAVCGSYAYYVWSHKKPKKITEENKTPIVEVKVIEESKVPESTPVQYGVKTAQDYGFIDVKAEDFSISKYCISNNPKVIYNDKLERFEIYNHYRSLNWIKGVYAKDVKRDENGEFMFDEGGYPIAKDFSLKETFEDLRQGIKDFFSKMSDEVFKRTK